MRQRRIEKITRSKKPFPTDLLERSLLFLPHSRLKFAAAPSPTKRESPSRTPSYKNLIHNIVKSRNQHTDNTWNRKMPYKLTDFLCSQIIIFHKNLTYFFKNKKQRLRFQKLDLRSSLLVYVKNRICFVVMLFYQIFNLDVRKGN